MPPGSASTYLELLARIKRRPGTYLGCRSISLLRVFLLGWATARGFDVEDTDVLNGFQDWVAERYWIQSSYGWADILLFHAEDERAAFEEFWRQFDEYLLSRGLPPIRGMD